MQYTYKTYVCLLSNSFCPIEKCLKNFKLLQNMHVRTMGVPWYIITVLFKHQNKCIITQHILHSWLCTTKDSRAMWVFSSQLSSCDKAACLRKILCIQMPWNYILDLFLEKLYTSWAVKACPYQLGSLQIKNTASVSTTKLLTVTSTSLPLNAKPRPKT